MSEIKDSRVRFSDRVVNYVKYRPSYPGSVVAALEESFGITELSLIADVGSGTGKLSEAFLENGYQVLGIEPNKEMREAGDKLLEKWQRFESLDASAESTGLPDSSVDLIIAGQSFHWFDRDLSKIEFQRIIKPNGGVALIWNERNETSPFLSAYEGFLHENASAYGSVKHRRIDDAVFERLFSDTGYQVFQDKYQQSFDFEGLLGRYLSSSYSFNAGHPQHSVAKLNLRALFDRFQIGGKVRFDYKTKVYHGCV